MTTEEYILSHTSAPDDVLQWLERRTHLRTNHARMLTGPLEGRLLMLISQMLRPQAVLELGVFTGYSTICLAAGLAEGGVIDSVEINDELEDLILESYERAGISDSVNLHLGDAMEIVPGLDRTYDLIYIDADKRQYPDYYRMVFDKLRPGGVILADNVLWNGKPVQEPVPSDSQTQGIVSFNDMVAGDSRVEKILLPLRDGLYIIRKKS